MAYWTSWRNRNSLKKREVSLIDSDVFADVIVVVVVSKAPFC